MLKMTEVLEARVKVTVKKTGKSYHRTMNYAKHVIIRSRLGQPKEEAVHEYFLRKGRRWKKVSQEEFKKATSKEAVKALHEELGKQLRQRVEQIMSEK